MGRLGRIEDSILALQNQIQGLAASSTPPIPVGWLMWCDDYIAPSANFPYLCLSDADKILTLAKWPLLVPHYRQKALTYMPGTASAQSDFNVISYAIASNVVTLTFANTLAEKKIISNLAEDNLVQGGFSNWRTITIPTIGAIAAGTYDITDLSAANRTVSFSFTSANVALTTINAMVKFYGHRLSSLIDPGNDQARHFQMSGRSLVSINDDDGECLAGLRRRDRGEIHSHGTTYPLMGTDITTVPAGTVGATFSVYRGGLVAQITSQISAGNGDPRIGKTTDPRSLIAVPYVYGGQYVA